MPLGCVPYYLGETSFRIYCELKFLDASAQRAPEAKILFAEEELNKEKFYNSSMSSSMSKSSPRIASV